MRLPVVRASNAVAPRLLTPFGSRWVTDTTHRAAETALLPEGYGQVWDRFQKALLA